jgi:transposase
MAPTQIALREPNLPVAFHDPVSWELKLLVDRREDLVGQRVAVMNRLFWRLHQIDPGRPEPKKLQHAVRREALADYLRQQSSIGPAGLTTVADGPKGTPARKPYGA